MRIVTALVALIVLAPPASSTPTVYFAPEVATVEQGQTLEMGIRVDAGVDTLTCFLVEFTFDSSVIELTNAEEGSLFSESGLPTMFDWDTISPDLQQCNDVTLGFENFVLCPGEIVHLEFLASGVGETSVAITMVDLRDMRRERILPVFTEAATVTVEPETGIEDGANALEPTLVCYPNPFGDATTLEFQSAVDCGPVEVVFYDASGRAVARTSFACSQEGPGVGRWKGEARDGRPLPAGVYYVVASGRFGTARDRVTLMR